MAGIRDLVPQLQSIRCASTLLGNIFMDRIGEFSELRVVELCTTSSKYIDLLKLKKVQAVHLDLSDLRHSKDQHSKEPIINVGRLSLDKFSIETGTASPLLRHFLGSIQAKEVVLDTHLAGNPMELLLAAVDSSLTSKLSLDDAHSWAVLLDSHLNRFHLLRHLTLNAGVKVSNSFFSTILATPLVTLHLDLGFDLDAQNLIDALKDPARPRELRRLELNNVKLQDDDWYCYAGGFLPEVWTDRCETEDITELRSMAQTGGFKVRGTAVEAQKMCRAILRQGEE
jgi:hypothetical protein